MLDKDMLKIIALALNQELCTTDGAVFHEWLLESQANQQFFEDMCTIWAAKTTPPKFDSQMTFQTFKEKIQH